MGKQGELCGTSQSHEVAHTPVVLAGFLPEHFSASVQIEMMAAGPQSRGSSVGVGEGAAAGSRAPPAGGSGASQGPMQQFFTKLRRHASLEGASPYFKIKKWKLDSSQRASSLDTRGNGASMV